MRNESKVSKYLRVYTFIQLGSFRACRQMEGAEIARHAASTGDARELVSHLLGAARLASGLGLLQPKVC